MKKLILFLGILTATTGFSQTVKEVGTFNSIAVFDKITATLIPSKENKVELSGAESENVELINKNGALKIKMSFAKTLQGDDVKAKVYYTSLEEITADEGSVIKADEVIKSNALKVNVKKGGHLTATVETERITVRGNSGGISNLKGKATFQDIVSNAGAEINHKKLLTKQTEVTANAGGIAEVVASDLVDAKTRAGGTIKVYGETKELREKNIAGGSVTLVKE